MDNKKLATAWDLINRGPSSAIPLPRAANVGKQEESTKNVRKENIASLISPEAFEEAYGRANKVRPIYSGAKQNQMMDDMLQQRLQQDVDTDLSPLMAMVDSWVDGSKLSEGYEKPRSADTDFAMADAVQNNYMEDANALNAFLKSQLMPPDQKIFTSEAGSQAGVEQPRAGGKDSGKRDEDDIKEYLESATAIKQSFDTAKRLADAVVLYEDSDGDLPGVGGAAGFMSPDWVARMQNVPILQNLLNTKEGARQVRAPMAELVNKTNKAMNSARATDADRKFVKEGLDLMEQGNADDVRRGLEQFRSGMRVISDKVDAQYRPEILQGAKGRMETQSGQGMGIFPKNSSEDDRKPKFMRKNKEE